MPEVSCWPPSRRPSSHGFCPAIRPSRRRARRRHAVPTDPRRTHRRDGRSLPSGRPRGDRQGRCRPGTPRRGARSCCWTRPGRSRGAVRSSSTSPSPARRAPTSCSASPLPLDQLSPHVAADAIVRAAHERAMDLPLPTRCRRGPGRRHPWRGRRPPGRRRQGAWVAPATTCSPLARARVKAGRAELDGAVCGADRTRRCPNHALLPSRSNHT